MMGQLGSSQTSRNGAAMSFLIATIDPNPSTTFEVDRGLCEFNEYKTNNKRSKFCY